MTGNKENDRIRAQRPILFAGVDSRERCAATDKKTKRRGALWLGRLSAPNPDGVLPPDGTDHYEKEVARDTAASLEPATGGLHLGVDGMLTAGTFWSGLIDDVRIHDRPVKP